ncbi:MAG: L,D-transpeptidase family protein [Verrucomicrobia bacterium]|nr:MAG: L,D-transpeptidase family protein [Verrucomicrobiota bacterium]
MNSFRTFFLLLLLVFLFSSCASYDHRLNDPSTRYLGLNGSLTSQERGTFADRISYWDGDAISGAPSIAIDLSEQRLYYYKGNKLVAISAVSTGAEGRETKTGHYRIMKKDLHHVSSECGDYVNNQGEVVIKNVVVREVPMPSGAHFVGSPMPYYMMVYPGVGMHTGFLPGVPDSHGCIRLPDRMAKIFFEVTPMGTPVTVQR